MRPEFAATVLSLALAATACHSNHAPVSEPSGAESAGQPPTTSPKVVAHFDASAGELPEGLAVTADAAYVGFAPTGRVVRVDTSTGQASEVGQLPVPVAGKGFMTGLAQSPAGELFAGLASFVPEVQAGIYRVPRGGAPASLFAKDAALPFPNALAFDERGELFVTDSGTGSVFRITADGQAERWAHGALLSGDKDGCDGAGPGFAIGANGLVVEREAVYVVNLDKATLLKIPRQRDGAAGEISVLVGPDCETLGGADGLARAPDGSFIVAVNRQNKLVRITGDEKVETMASGAPFDFPASVAFRGPNLFVTNFALKNASAGKPAAAALLELRH